MSQRIDEIRAILRAEGWDAILISDQDNRYFASGYRAEDHSGRSSGVLLITPDRALVVYQSEQRRLGPGGRARL